MAATDEGPRFGCGEVIQRLDDGTRAVVVAAGLATYTLRIAGRFVPSLIDRTVVEAEWTEAEWTEL